MANNMALQQIEQRIAQLERENAALRRKKSKAKHCPSPRTVKAQQAQEEPQQQNEPLPFIFKAAMFLLGLMVAIIVLPIGCTP